MQRDDQRRSAIPWPVRMFIALIAVGIVWFGALAARVYSFSLTTDCRPADAAIVLGAAVWQGEPSPVFEERIKHGINLYQAGTVKTLIFTGGVGLGDTVAEADVGRAYAVARGLASTAILTETVSRVTSANLTEARALMGENGLETALIVSDPLHMRRAMALAWDLDLAAYSCPTPTSRYQTWRTKWGFLLRETRLYAQYLIRRL